MDRGLSCEAIKKPEGGRNRPTSGSWDSRRCDLRWIPFNVGKSLAQVVAQFQQKSFHNNKSLSQNRRGLAGHHRRDGRAEAPEHNVPAPPLGRRFRDWRYEWHNVGEFTSRAQIRIEEGDEWR